VKRDYPNLCKPIQINGVTFRNRMCSAPMGATDILADGTPGPRTQGFYELRAKAYSRDGQTAETQIRVGVGGERV